MKGDYFSQIFFVSRGGHGLHGGALASLVLAVGVFSPLTRGNFQKVEKSLNVQRSIFHYTFSRLSAGRRLA